MSGPYNLGDVALSVPLTNQVITEGVSANGVAQAFIDGLDWMAATTLFCNFIYGSGGTTCAVTVQTSLDGVNWVDIARFDFAQASLAKHCNLSGLTPKNVALVTALGSESVLDGILGERLRAKVTTTGVYAGNTALSVRAVVR